MFLIALALAAVPIAHAEPVDPATPALSGPAVVILWASWCANCKAELARLPRLASAAAPLSIKTLAIDAPSVARSLLRDRGVPLEGAYADARAPRTVLDDWGGPGAILPIAIAVDGKGRTCGRKAGLLGTDDLKRWAVQCR